MPGARDGEKFGEALEKAQKDRFDHDFQNYKNGRGAALKLYKFLVITALPKLEF